jgi:hypothetical protein
MKTAMIAILAAALLCSCANDDAYWQARSIFWVLEAMLTVFACYCFGLAIYRKIRVGQEVMEGQTTPSGRRGSKLESGKQT